MKPRHDRTPEVNKLQGEYLSSSLNHTWTIDITKIKTKFYWFLIMDLASRRVVAYNCSNHDYTTIQAINIFEKALLLETLVKPVRPVQSVHTDSAGIFLAKEWKKFLEVNQIEPSSAGSKTMQNQVSERFNRTFKKILRKFLNQRLNKPNNKTSTFQLIVEYTKYNFEKLQVLTDEIILYYNTERPHQHLNHLTPDNWALKARNAPDHKFILKEKESFDQSESMVLATKEIEPLINKDQIHQTNPIDLLTRYDIVPFVPLSKNDNSMQAKLIREYRNNIGVLNLRESVAQNKIDLSTIDVLTKNTFEDLSQNNENWERNVKYLETLVLLNQVLLYNLEELKNTTQDLKDQTQDLKDQNDELLLMNQYLVQKAHELEEKERLVLERKTKRQSARKLERRVKN